MNAVRPQHILADVGNDVSIDVPDDSATATVSLYDDDGSAVFEDTSATVDTVDTTLNGAVSAGARSMIVTAATGIVSGRELWVRTPDEKVLVRTIDSTTAALARPLLYDHATGVTVEGTRLTYTVSAAYAADEFWDGHLVWTLASGRKIYQAACCTKYPFDTDFATEQDLFDHDPMIDQKLPASADTGRMLVKGAEEIIKRLTASTSGRAFTFPTVPQFTDAVCLATLIKFYEPQTGDEAQRLYNRYEAALDRELKTIMSGLVYRDGDQDGAIERHEQRSYGSGRRYRA